MPGSMAMENGHAAVEGVKKRKKVKVADPVGGDVAVAASPPVSDSKKKRKKKKAEVASAEATNGHAVEASKSKKKRAKSPEDDGAAARKIQKVVENGDKESGAPVDAMAVSNFNICKALRDKLKSKGIESLFPIQAQMFDAVFSGNDIVGRTGTGQGLTLAFVLPVLQSLTQGGQVKNLQEGRTPTVIVLAPSRELAKRVHADFETYGNAVGLSTVCVHGGHPYFGQEVALRRGVDIVVGTPARIKVHLERKTLNLENLKFRVLAEADEMLSTGAGRDVKLILRGVDDPSKVQTLLFSATLPEWVRKIAARFLKPSWKTVDLVGDHKMKASNSVKHLLLPGRYSMWPQLVQDVISCYGSGGRIIVFTETMKDASELAGALKSGTAGALHGDIPQNQREATLQAFLSGKFGVLVTTDDVARGLDINDVQLVVQCRPPRDVETYIHRSGRTGRAGNTGISVLFFTGPSEYMIPRIERKAGFKFERIVASQPADIAKASGNSNNQASTLADIILSL